MPVSVGPVEAARATLDALARGEDLIVVTVVEPPALAGPRLLVGEDGAPRGGLGDAELDAAALKLAAAALASERPMLEAVHVSAGRRMLYVEANRAPDQLVVVGAGHIAVPLARLGAALGFAVTVLDDRAEFATEQRFAPGVRVLHANFEDDPFAGLPIRARSYVTLVTRGHRWDFDCLRRLLAAPVQPKYIGMIGSRRRVRAALRALLDAGEPREKLAAVRAPIGLEIGAETPEEIAVSIAAELIAVRHDTRIPGSADRERVLDRLLPEESVDG